MTFSVKIGLVSSGNVAGSISVSFLGRSPLTFGFNIRMNSLLSMAKDLADTALIQSLAVAGVRHPDLVRVTIFRIVTCTVPDPCVGPMGQLLSKRTAS
eukprot:m.233640 g.233640  ORF g.233640 m.233640 type:complete len:98 (+) comp40093_c0_seq7:598-891(+)